MKGFLKKGIIVALTLGVTLSIGQVTTNAASSNAASSKADQYKMVWSDEFNGSALNRSNWNYNIGNGGANQGWGNNEMEYYTDRTDNVKVSNGILSIIGRADNYQFEENGTTYTTKYTSGRILSSGLQSFKYGRVEARIKVPNDRGMWPAFWMLGYNEKGWPWCGEIDILETWNSYNFAQGAIHYVDELSSKPTSDHCEYNSITMSNKNEWHTYGLTWTPKKMEWTLDGKVFYTFPITGSNKSELREKFYIILNMAIGGNLPGVGPVDSFTSATTQVDSVRVYQRTSDKGTYDGTWSNTEKSQVQRVMIKFNNGKKTISTQQLLVGESAIIPSVKKSGYIFKGWYNGKNKITQSTGLYSSQTITAKWEKIKVKCAKITSTKQKYKKCATIKFKVSKYKKQKVTGFQVKIGNKKKFVTKTKITMKKFKSQKTYIAKVRAYKLDSKGKKIYGKWSKTKKITVK